jgi:hypothetical protein
MKETMKYWQLFVTGITPNSTYPMGGYDDRIMGVPIRT